MKNLNNMREYKIKYRAIFEGELKVRAEGKTEARRIVEEGFGGLIASVSEGTAMTNEHYGEGVIDYDFPTHPKTVLVI
jgi:hypothetical protein